MNLILNGHERRVLALACALVITGCSTTPASRTASDADAAASAAITPVAAPADETTAATTALPSSTTQNPAASSATDTSAATQPAETINASTGAADNSASANDAAATDDKSEQAPNWMTIESTVVSLGEEDLLDRIRAGFELKDVVDERVDREEQWYTNHPDYMDRTFRRAERYLYYIVSELEARKMPLELALLPVVESAFNPTALSRAKASGLWQFIPATGRRFGLKQNTYYDGRRDIVESTRAALDYFQFLAQEFNGDWYLAIAAYNSGELNVSRAVERNRAKGLPTDFFSLELPRETEAYVPKLLAMRRIINDPKAHGLAFGSLQNQPYFVKVDLKGQIDLALAAELAGMTQEDFLAINPGFKRGVTGPNGPHHLLIPVQNEQMFMEKLAALPPNKRVRTVFYRVRRGDTLSTIAVRYGMSAHELMTLNHLHSRTIRPGSELLLRGARIASTATASTAKTAYRSTSAQHRQVHVVTSGDTIWGIARQYDVDADDLISVNHIRHNSIRPGQKLRIPQAVTVNANPEDTEMAMNKNEDAATYVVRSGDTLYDIAAQFNVNVKQLMDWNNIDSPTSLRPGQRLVLSD